MINLGITVYAAPVNINSSYYFGGINSLAQGLGALILPAFSLAAVALVIYFLIGAFKLITSAGQKEEVAAAQKMITHAIIGFVLLIVMFFVLQYLPPLIGLTGFVIVNN